MICHTWDPQRCTKQAIYWLIQPDGKRNPGGWVCAEHGEAVIQEYREKLGEQWALQPINDLGESAVGNIALIYRSDCGDPPVRWIELPS